MFSLEYKKLHHWLFRTIEPSSNQTGLAAIAGVGKPIVPMVNPANKRSGIHLAQEQIFNTGGLGVILYVRNSFSEHEQPTGVKIALKLLFTHKKDGSGFHSPTDSSSLALELGIESIPYFYQWLQGCHEDFNYRLIKSNQAPKEISGYKNSSGEFDLTLSASMAGNNIKVCLNQGDILRSSIVCLAVLKLHYPDVSETALSQLLLHNNDGVGKPRDTGTSNNHHAEIHTLIINMFNETNTEKIAHPKHRAIWAIANERWPAKRLDVAQLIQNQGCNRLVQHLIDDANKGEFGAWDRICMSFDQYSQSSTK